MINKKIRVDKIVQPNTFVLDAIRKVDSSALDNLTGADMKKIEKTVVESIMAATVKNIEAELVSGNSVEFPELFNVEVFDSKNTHRVTKEKTIKRKLRVKTRVSLLRTLAK